MSISAFFRDTLGANFLNSRWSWGAIDPVHDRLFLRLWDDQIDSKDGERHALVLREHWTNSNGYDQRVRHIAAMRNGTETFGVQCTANTLVPGEDRKIKAFKRDVLLRLGELVDREDGIYARILGDLPTAQLDWSPSGFSTLVPDLRALQRKKLEATTREALVDARVGQGRFRTQVLASWDYRCAVTGTATLEAVRASHIRPWRDSTDEQRLDPENGLPLLASFDALFDAGLISFGRDGLLLISSALPETERSLLGLYCQRLTKLPSSRTIEYLDHHRTKIFSC